MKNTITAIIPVREGSRRLKNKNIAPFAGTNLLINKISQLKQVKEITNIVVSSDSDLMLAMAETQGVHTHKRAVEFCDEKTKTFGEVVAHICEHVPGDDILWATCTAPLVFPKHYREAITLYYKALEAGYDSLASMEQFKRYLWDEKGPVNYEFGIKHVPSQQLPPLYFVTDGILLAPRHKMIDWKYFHGSNPYRYILDKRTSIDIDDGLDLACARAWLDMDESVSQIVPYDVTKGEKNTSKDGFSITPPLPEELSKPIIINKAHISNLRTKIRDSLKKLKEKYGVVAIKAEFEAEGSRKDELIMLRELVEPAELRLVIKIGGCEAVHDIDQCKLLDVTGIMAPMIETPFAIKKFRNAVEKIYGTEATLEKIINAETISCFKNFDDILEEGKGFLTGVTVGRSDLSASMGIRRDHIEEEEVFNVTKTFCEKAKKAGLITNFGGNIGVESIPFIIKMMPYIDRFETRKVVLEKNDDSDFLKKAIIAALEFELLYLHLKSEYYASMANEDSQRIIRLEKQINSVKITPPLYKTSYRYCFHATSLSERRLVA